MTTNKSVFLKQLDRELLIQAYCCCLVAKLCPILCVPVDCSTPSFPVLHYLPECAQIVDMYTLPYTKQITNKDLLYSTGNHSVLCGDLSGKEIQEGIYAHT